MEFRIDQSRNINKVDASNIANNSGTNQHDSKRIEIFNSNDDAIIQLCKRLGITKEQLEELNQKYPDFYRFDPAKQAEIINIEKNNAVSNSVDTKVAQDESNINISDNNSAQNSDDAQETSEVSSFNHKEYSKLPLEEKANVFAQELAKNKFLFDANGNSKTIEEWNNLSDEEKDNLIKKEYSNFVKDNSKGLYAQEDVNLYLDKEMTKLQTASSLKTNYSKFNEKDSKYINMSVHDYILNCPDEDKLSDNQLKYIESQSVLSKAIVDACKQKDNSSYPDGVEFILSGEEIDGIFSNDGLLAGKTRFEVQMEYLQNKVDKGIKLDEKEQAVYDNLNKFTNSDIGKAYLNAVKYKSEHPDEQVNYGRLDALKNSEFGKDFESAENDENKAFVVKAYIRKATKNLSSEEKAKFINELISEMTCNKDDAVLAANVHADVVENSDEATQKEIMKTKSDVIPELNALNVDVVKSNNVIKSLAITHEEMLDDDPERAEMLASATLDNLSNKKLLAVSSVYSASKSENIQSKHADKAITLEINSVEDIDIQREALGYVAGKSSLTVRKNTAKRLDEVHKDNQIPLTEKFIEDKEVAKAMNEDGTLTRFYKDNQTPGFELFKNRFERDDFSKNEAISQLNTLADQIKDCHKDNQLDMHKRMMQSKYSEVQEHTAGNIRDYDTTVQSQALDAVYTSGNEKAIKKAVTSLENAPTYIQEAELPRIIGETALRGGQDSLNILTNDADSNANLKLKIASGAPLSPSEYNNLSSSEKREYFANYFKKLPLEQKIKLLSSIPNGAQKKTIYVMIARTDSNLFNAIIKDKDRADALLSMGLPPDVDNKIAGVVKFLAVSDIGYQNIANKYDIDYKNQDKPSNILYNTNPYGFDSKELFRKDKNGNLVG